MKNNEDIADENMKRRKEEEERERQTELALARKYLENNYSDDVKRSIQNVDESILNYELIENALSAIIRKELKEGMESIVPKGGKLMEKDTYGAFLIFMPGQAEILKLIRVFEQSRLLEVSDVGELDFLPLYGQLSAAEQRRIFQKPRLGVRKIVVATNIAETSVTIDDIRYVIDTGRQKDAIRLGERFILPRRLLGLQGSSEAETWKSRKNDAWSMFSTVFAHAIRQFRENASTRNVANTTSVVSFEHQKYGARIWNGERNAIARVDAPGRKRLGPRRSRIE